MPSRHPHMSQVPAGVADIGWVTPSTCALMDARRVPVPADPARASPGPRHVRGRAHCGWSAAGHDDLPDSPGLPAAPAPASAVSVQPTGAGNLPVLYIDDNAVNTLLMEAMFERLPGLSLVCETDPRAGLALALAQPPALLLVDIQMPDLDGYALLRLLRANPATRDVPAIAVSANAMPQDLVRGRAAGFVDYLTKPLEMDRLQQALQAVLPGWQAPD